MKQQGVSIVLCSNCEHDHPQGVCLETIYAPQGDPVEVCGCHDYQPILRPFAGVPPKPKPYRGEGDSPWLVALAFALLLAVIAYAEWGIR